MREDYEKSKNSIGLSHGVSNKEVDLIDRVQFEFIRDKMKEMKSVRLPNFGIFLVKTRFRNG